MTTTEQTVQTAVSPTSHMSEAEFETWALRKRIRAEWVQGEVILMSPVNLAHFDLTNWLVTVMRMHAAKHDLGRVGGSELMVRLPSRRRLPDLLFVRKDRADEFQKTYFEGPPDLIVEVVSPDSGPRNWREKYLEYQANGVREYWVLDPAAANAEFYQLVDARYTKMATHEGVIRSEAFTGFWLKIEWLWQNPLPSELEVAKTIGII